MGEVTSVERIVKASPCWSHLSGDPSKEGEQSGPCVLHEGAARRGVLRDSCHAEEWEAAWRGSCDIECT